MQQFNMTVVHVPGKWNNPADGISRLDTENLPVALASNLTSATTVEALEDFLITHRGTNPGELTLEEGDRIVDVTPMIGSVLFTAASLTSSSCHLENCLLCQPTLGLEEEEAGGAKCFLALPLI